MLAPTGDPDTFTVEPGTGLTGERARFRRLAGGEVSSVLLMETTWERLEPAGRMTGRKTRQLPGKSPFRQAMTGNNCRRDS